MTSVATAVPVAAQGSGRPGSCSGSLVALPRVAGGDLDPATAEVVLAVVAWRSVWQHVVRAPGERWR